MSLLKTLKSLKSERLQSLIEMDNTPLIYTKVREVKSPNRAHPTDGGIDFYVPNEFKKIKLGHGEDINIDSGLKVVVPKGFILKIEGKSGVSINKKLDQLADIIDSDYRGEIHYHLINSGKKPCTIEAGDKIVQGILYPVSLCNTKEVSNKDYEIYCNTDRGEGGFGSTGTK